MNAILSVVLTLCTLGKTMANEKGDKWLFQPLEISHYTEKGTITRANIYKLPVALYFIHTFNEVSKISAPNHLKEYTASSTSTAQPDVNIASKFGIKVSDPDVATTIEVDLRSVKKPEDSSLTSDQAIMMTLECVRLTLANANSHQNPEEDYCGEVSLLVNDSTKKYLPYAKRLSENSLKKSLFRAQSHQYDKRLDKKVYYTTWQPLELDLHERDLPILTAVPFHNNTPYFGHYAAILAKNSLYDTNAFPSRQHLRERNTLRRNFVIDESADTTVNLRTAHGTSLSLKETQAQAALLLEAIRKVAISKREVEQLNVNISKQIDPAGSLQKKWDAQDKTKPFTPLP